MLNVIIPIIAVFIATGCLNDKVDTGFLNECPAPTICETCPECPPCDETIYGQLEDGWVEKIEEGSIKLNHYIDEVMLEENYAEIFDRNGTLISRNPLTLPAYEGQKIKHTLIVEFWQIK